MNFRTWLNEDYQSWTAKLQDNLWVHCSDHDYVQIKYDTRHCDPLGIYLFPNIKSVTSEFKTKKFRFLVQVSQDLSVLDISHLDDNDLLKLAKKLGLPNHYIKDMSKDLHNPDDEDISALLRSKGEIWRGITDYFCDTTKTVKSSDYVPGMPYKDVRTGQAQMNSRLRALGYDAIFDDSNTIYEDEVQLIVLNPRKLKVVRKETVGAKRSGYHETVEIMQSAAKYLSGLGAIQLKLPQVIKWPDDTPDLHRMLASAGLHGVLKVGAATWIFNTPSIRNVYDPVKISVSLENSHFTGFSTPILFNLSKPESLQRGMNMLKQQTAELNRQQQLTHTS